jgi:hypothetical protein
VSIEAPPFMQPATMTMTQSNLTLWLSMSTHVCASPLIPSRVAAHHHVLGHYPCGRIICHYGSTARWHHQAASSTAPPCSKVLPH